MYVHVYIIKSSYKHVSVCVHLHVLQLCMYMCIYIIMYT